MAPFLVAFGVVLLFAAQSPTLRRRARALGRTLRGGHAHFVTTVTADHFQRGNLHTHSTRSDGTAPLYAMVEWYRSHGYQFVAMTEHNLRVDSAEIDAFATPGFVVIPGEEVTNFWASKPLHVNALCPLATVRGAKDFERAETGLAVTFEDIRAQAGIPLVDHPNFHWALSAGEIAHGASGRYLLEIWSGHPDVHPEGDAVHPSAEQIWDELLARDADVIPIAVDDAHGLPGDPAGGDALPGRAWVETFGEETLVNAICGALGDGRLYASNGPALARIRVEGSTFAVATTDAEARVAFIGERGEILGEVRAAEVPARDGVRELTYELSGGETLVRARLADTAGHCAWTAAYRVTG
jgi:hypothetical protein